MSILDIAQPQTQAAPQGNIFDAAGNGPDIARSRVAAAVDANPDQAAKSLVMEGDLGVPAQVIDNDFQNFSKLHQISTDNAVVNGNEFLQTYLNSHPMAARVSKDDLPQLDAVSSSVKDLLKKPYSQRLAEWTADQLKQGNYSSVALGTLSTVVAGALEMPFHFATMAKKAYDEGLSPQEEQEAALTGAFLSQMYGATQNAGLIPHLEAGKPPPIGMSPITDEIHKIQTVADQADVGEALTQAQASQTRERAPDLFQSFIAQHTNDKLGVSADAIRALYGDKVPQPNDGILGWVPRLQEQLQAAEATGGDVEIPVAAFLTRAEPELWAALKDNIRFREGGLTAEEAKALPPSEPTGQPVEDIRQASGLAPKPQYTITRSDTAGQAHVYNITGPEGDAGHFYIREDEGGRKLYIDDIVANDGAGALGTGAMRDILRQIKTEFPNAEVLEGQRVSGARETAGGTGTKASVSMRRVQPKQLELPVEGTTRMEDRQPLAKPNVQEQKYFKLIAKQVDEDRAALQEHLEAAERRQTTQAFRNRTEELRPEVEDEVRGMPGLALDEMLRGGKIKLSREGLTDEQIAALPRDYISADGVHPDDLAGVLGHQSGGDLVGDLLNHLREREASGLGPKAFYNKLVKDRLAQRVEGELGPSAADRLGEIKDRVLSETTEDLLHEETLRAATEAGLQYPIDKKVVKDAILRSYRKLAIGDISSDRFLADAGRAGRAVEASLLKDDAAEAFRQRQRRDWAFMMAREARKTEKAMEQFERTARRFSAREVSSVDQEYTNYIHDILQRVGKQVKRSVQDLAKAIGDKSIAEFAAYKQAHDLREVPIADFLGDPSFRKPFDELSVDEFDAVHNSIKTLIKNGRDEQTITRAGEAQDLAAVKAQMVDQLRRFGEIKYDAEGKPMQRFAGVRHLLKTALVSHLQVENVLSRLDRFDPNGVFTQFIYRDLASAANHEAKLLREYSTKLGDIADTANLKEKIPNNIFISPFDKDKPVDAQSPMAMTRKNLRAVLLNWGNESNKLKLARGYGVDPSLVQMWLNHHATKADWDWAQKVWDLFSELHDQSNIMYENLAGVAPEALDIRPIDTPHGQYKGGYYPLIRHPTFGEDVKLPSGGLEEQGYVRATTPAGYTKARTGAIYPLALDLDALPNRLRQIIHDVAFRPAVINAGKIFYDKGIKAEMVKHLGKEYANMFVPWLRDVANVQNFVSSAERDFGYWSDFMRQNAVTTLVGFNPGTALKHTPTALISSMAEVGPVNFLKAMRSMVSVNEATSENGWQFAMRSSEELQRRSRNWSETMGGGLAALENRAGVVKSVAQGEYGAAFMSLREAITELSSKPVALGDLLSAVPTWMAQYEKSMADHGVHGDAIAEADRAVRRAHGSSAITSRSAVARNRSALGHWMTGFFTFFNDIFNRQVETLWRAGEAYDLAKEGQYGAAMSEAGKVSGRLFAYVIAPAMIEELVSPMTNKDHESWGAMAAKSLAFTLSSSWIGVRDVVNAVLNKRDPSVGLLSTAEKSISDVVRDVTSKQMKAGNVIKHGTQLGGMLSGLTPAPIGRAAEFALSGEHPRGPWGWATGLRYGTLRSHAPTFQQWMRGH